MIEPRSGYADLREEFCDLVDMNWWRTHPRFHAVASGMYGDNGVVPGDTCDAAGMPHGSTYAEVAKKLHDYLDECVKKGTKP